MHIMAKRYLVIAAVLVVCLLLGATPVWAQLAQVAGKVTDDGKPQPGVTVVYKSQTTGRVVKMKANNKAEFFQVGVPIDTYTVSVLDTNGKEVFKQDGVRVGVGGDNVENKMDIDLTNGATSNSPGVAAGPGGPGPRTEQFHGDNSKGGAEVGNKTASQPKMSKEELDALKVQRAKAESANVLIKQANDAMTAKNWQAALPPLNQLVTAEPTHWEYYSALGDAETNLGNFDEAVGAYSKGIEVAGANTAVDSKNPNTDPAKKKAGMARMYNGEGNAYLKLKKNNEAVAAFEKAASLDPNPGAAYFNLCATQYNTGNMEGAETACDKAIAADPNKADAYFIKGSAMYGKGKQEGSKYTVPPGTTEALNKYLQLAPDGPHANDVKAMLEFLGAKIETTYKAKKK
jgi:tetratricopeptide (TPR) repeat protein